VPQRSHVPRHVVGRAHSCIATCGFQAETDTATSALSVLQADQAANGGAGIGVSTDGIIDDA
jgi:hypothetical protein